MRTPFKNGLMWIINSCLTGFDTSMQNAVAVLTCQRGDAGTFAGAFALNGESLNTAWEYVAVDIAENIIEPFCLIILAICVLIELANTAMKMDMIRWEQVLRVGVKLVLAMVCMDIAPSLLEACYIQASSWIASVGGTSISLGSLLGDAFDGLLGDIGLGGLLVLAVGCLIAFLGFRICGIIVVVIAIARIFEILVYIAVSPIPCAFFPFGGDGGGGLGISRITINFFKNFIAVCLQGLLMVICLRVFDIIVVSMTDDFVQNLIGEAAVDESGATTLFNLGFTLITLAFTLVCVMTRCGNWAKSIIDAH